MRQSALTIRGTILLSLYQQGGFGAEIIARIRERTEGRIELYPATIYPVLANMYQEDLVTRDTRMHKNNTVHYYELTPKGNALAQSEIATIQRLTAKTVEAVASNRSRSRHGA